MDIKLPPLRPPKSQNLPQTRHKLCPMVEAVTCVIWLRCARPKHGKFMPGWYLYRCWGGTHRVDRRSALCLYGDPTPHFGPFIWPRIWNETHSAQTLPSEVATRQLFLGKLPNLTSLRAAGLRHAQSDVTIGLLRFSNLGVNVLQSPA